MIEIKDVTVKFKDIVALDHVSLSVPKGEITGVIGRNGSGKTVLFKTICGFVRLNEGTILMDGKPVRNHSVMYKKIGIIIEHPGFVPNLSGYKNLQYLAQLNRTIGNDRIREVMEQVGLDPKLKKHVRKYSLGMKQRLGLAQAIMEYPEILILDEPMNGLDNSGVEEIRKLLLSFKAEGKTILLATHNPLDVEMLCDHVYELDHGRLVS